MSCRKHVLGDYLKESLGLTDINFHLQIAEDDSIVLNKEQKATVTFTNPFSHPVDGVLTIAGAGLIQGKVHLR